MPTKHSSRSLANQPTTSGLISRFGGRCPPRFHRHTGTPDTLSSFASYASYEIRTALESGRQDIAVSLAEEAPG